MPPEEKKPKQGGVRLPNATDLNWRVKPEDSLSDWTIQVIVEGSEEKQTYHVHRNILSLGKVRSDYFRAFFRANMALPENETSTSVLRLPFYEANSMPCLLDHLYGLLDDKVINEEFESIASYELIELLSLADSLQTTGLDHVFSIQVKHHDFGDSDFSDFLYSYFEKYEEFGFRKETDTVVVSMMSELVMNGKFANPENFPVIPPEFLSKILRKILVMPCDVDLDHLHFFDRVLALQKASLPQDFFETTFDQEFRVSFESRAETESLIVISLILLNLEYHVGCQLTPLKKWCRQCLSRGLRDYRLNEDPDESNPFELVLDVFGNDKKLLYKCTEKIPSSVILEVMLE